MSYMQPQIVLIRTSFIGLSISIVLYLYFLTYFWDFDEKNNNVFKILILK